MTKYHAQTAKQAEDQARIAYLCNSFGTMDMDYQDEESDEETDDEVLQVNGTMAVTGFSGACEMRAHLEYVNAWFGNTKTTRMYAISDSGADATIVGSAAHVINYSGRNAIISGYDPESTKSGQVPIVTALLKV